MTLPSTEKLQMDEGHGQPRSSHSRSLSCMIKKELMRRSRNGAIPVGVVEFTASLKMI